MKHLKIYKATFIIFSLAAFINLSAQSFDEIKISEYYWNTPLEKVITDFSEKYNIKFEFDSEIIKGYKFSYLFSETSADRAIELLFKYDKGRGNIHGDKLGCFIDVNGVVHITKKKEKTIVEKKTNYKFQGEPSRFNFTLSGKIKDKYTGESLPYSTVYQKTTKAGTTSNIDGYFTLFKVTSDTVSISVSYIGYQSLEYFLSPQDDIKNLIIELSPTVTNLNEVQVTAQRKELMKVSDKVSVIKMTPKEIANLPNIGEKDIMRSFQLMPGISASNEASSGLYVRGGTPDQNLVLYDGFTVYHVDHLFGFFSAFNSNAIKDVQLYKGGFESKYGGRISSVTELTGKDGNQNNFNIAGDVSLMSINGFVEFPIGNKITFIAAARRSWKGPLYNAIFDKFTTENEVETMMTGRGRKMASTETTVSSFFYDVNSKLTYKPTGKDIFSISFYNGTDKMDNSRIMEPPAMMANSNMQMSNDIIDYNNWGNTGASLKWSRKWSPRFFGNALVSYSEFFSTRDRSVEGTRTDANGETTNFKRGTVENNNLKDFSIKLDYEWKLGSFNNIEFGGQITNNDIKYTYTQNDTVTVLNRADAANTYSIYLQDKLSFLDNRITFIPGLRYSYFDNTNKFYPEPRVSAKIDITKKLSLKGAWGEYNQFANRVIREDIMSGSREFWILSDGEDVLVSNSTHNIVGFSYDTKDYLFDVEAYYKDLNGLSEYSLRFSPSFREVDYEENFFQGNGYARGIDFLLQKKTGKLTGWIGYTLSEVLHDFPDISDEPFYASHDVTNEFKVVGMYKYKKWNFSSTWICATGKPYTSPEGGYDITLLDGSTQDYVAVGAKNGLHLPEYHRLDISAKYNFEMGESKSPGSISFSIFNLYNRNNTWYKEYEIEDGILYETNVNFLGITPNITLSLSLK